MMKEKQHEITKPYSDELRLREFTDENITVFRAKKKNGYRKELDQMV